VLLIFFDYPAEHGVHLKTSNPNESTFATVRLRTKVTKGPGSKAAGLAMAFKLIEAAQDRWRSINAPHLVAVVRAGAKLDYFSPPRESLTAEQARQLLASADGERLGALVATGLMLGLRPGVMRLKAHRALQAEERLRAGDGWEDHGLIFAIEGGTPLDPCHVRRTFTRVSKRAGLGSSFPYALRHSTASLLIDGGASIEEEADLFGDDPRTLYKHHRRRIRPVAEAASRMTSILAPPAEA
jgi:integrase